LPGTKGKSRKKQTKTRKKPTICKMYGHVVFVGWYRLQPEEENGKTGLQRLKTLHLALAKELPAEYTTSCIGDICVILFKRPIPPETRFCPTALAAALLRRSEVCDQESVASGSGIDPCSRRFFSGNG